MGYLIIIAIIAYIVWSNYTHSAAYHNAQRPRLAQKAYDAYNKTEKAFMKNMMPFWEYFKCLDDYYKKGGKKLTNAELNKYLSYPKHIYLNEKDEVICNNVNLGHIDDCFLFNRHGWFGYQDQWKNKTRYGVFKDAYKGNMIIDEYKLAHDFTAIYNEISRFPDNEKDGNEKRGDYLKYVEPAVRGCNQNIGEYEKTFKENKEIIDKYISDELKAVYEKIEKEDLNLQDIEKELLQYYAKSNIDYLKELKENHKKIDETHAKDAILVNHYEGKNWGGAEYKFLFNRYYDKEQENAMNEGDAGFFRHEYFTGHQQGVNKYTHEKTEWEANEFEKEVIKKYDLKMNY